MDTEVDVSTETAVAETAPQGDTAAPDNPAVETASGAAPATADTVDTSEETDLDSIFGADDDDSILSQPIPPGRGNKFVRGYAERVQKRFGEAHKAVEQFGGVQNASEAAKLHKLLVSPQFNPENFVTALTEVYGSGRARAILEHGGKSAGTVREEEIFTRHFGRVLTPDDIHQVKQYLLTGGHKPLSPEWVAKLPDVVRYDANSFERSPEELMNDPYVKGLLAVEERLTKDAAERNAERDQREQQERQTQNQQRQTAAAMNVEKLLEPIYEMTEKAGFGEDELFELEARVTRELQNQESDLYKLSLSYLTNIVAGEEQLAKKDEPRLASLIRQTVIKHGRVIAERKKPNGATVAAQVKQSSTQARPDLQGAGATNSKPIDESKMTLSERLHNRGRMREASVASQATRQVVKGIGG